jgi:3-hydroxyisobutyrate dehydrogenase-like beta-hydroxyacid dehydrogenase
MNLSKDTKIGVIGFGSMGQPIADNIIKAGFQVVVSSRTKKTLDYFKNKATIADSPIDVIEQANIILFVLPTNKEIEEIVSAANKRLRNKTLLNLSTISPKSSVELNKIIKKFGGEYVECLISGSRKPAIDGTLLLLTAGSTKKIDSFSDLFNSFSRKTVHCGKIPNASKMKLANNLLLITMFNGLMEAVNFARQIGLKEKEYLEMIDSGPMSNAVFKSKYQKILDHDYSAQAPLRLVYKDTRLICDLANEYGISLPLFTNHRKLLKKGLDSGLGDLDIISIVKELKKR